MRNAIRYSCGGEDMNFVSPLLRLIDRVSPPETVSAHCDIPCGIYDPHAAQIAALTTVRMVQLMEGLAAPSDSATPTELATYHQQMARYAVVKEQHASIAEHELVILWTDYFKPEHLEKYPQ